MRRSPGKKGPSPSSTSGTLAITIQPGRCRDNRQVTIRWDRSHVVPVAAEVSLAHTLGMTAATIALSAGAKRGTAFFPLDLGRIPAGPATIAVAVLDRLGHRVATGVHEWLVPATGGERPAPIQLNIVKKRLVRPVGGGSAFVRAIVNSEPVGALSTLFLRVEGPDGFCQLLDLPAPPSRIPVALFAIGSAHHLGTHSLTAVVVGPGGEVGAESRASFELVGRKGGPALRIDGVETAKDGSRLTIRGRGFATAATRIEVGTTPTAILELSDRVAIIQAPALDQPAPVRVTTPAGIAISPVDWTPPIRVKVVPSELTLAEGETFSLAGLVSGTLNRRVTWSLRGPTGEQTTISPAGRLSAGYPGKPIEFTVVARSVADKRTVGTAVVRIAAGDRALPSGTTIGRLGGVVASDGGGASVVIGRGQLSRPTRITIRSVGPTRRIRRRGPMVVGEVHVRGKAKLGGSAEIQLPLAMALDPKTAFVVETREGGVWKPRDHSIPPWLDGTTLHIPLERIPFWVRVGIPVNWIDVIPAAPVPTISTVGPNVLDEGVTAAVLVTGTNFIPGVTRVHFLNSDGTPEPRVEVRSVAVKADGTQLGIGLKVGVMTDLAEGQSRILTIRVETPTGSADSELAIAGHDELDVLTGTRTISESARFSRITVEPGAGVVVASKFPPIAIECFERAQIRSPVGNGGGLAVVAGVAGSPTIGDAGGAGGLGGGGTGPAGIGAGGDGGNGATGMSGRGARGAAGRGSIRLTLAGAGGAGGGPGGFGPFPHAGGEGDDGTAGRRHTAPGLLWEDFEPSPGGGGGGGGGGEGMIFQSTGGGGGGGGAGGGAVRVAAGEELTLDGDVVAAGGDGRFGAQPTNAVSVFTLIRAGAGGGGGGGAGGAVVLQGLTAGSGAILSVGGRNGHQPRVGPAPADGRTLRQILFQQLASGSVRVDGSAVPVVVGDLMRGPDLAYTANLLATSDRVEVTAPGADRVRVRSGSREATFPVTAPGSRTEVVLLEGFNEVSAEYFELPDGRSWFECAEIRRRKFLYLPGTIPFLEFACTIAPPAASVPTERVLGLSATVVSRPATTLLWDVLGGDTYGTVQPTGSGAQYTAPSIVPPGVATVRAAASVDPSRVQSVLVTVVPGVELQSTPTSGTRAPNGLAPGSAANVGQMIDLTIPAAVFQTGQGFGLAQTVEFEVLAQDSAGAWTVTRSPFQGFVHAGLASLDVDVPAGAAPIQQVRVPGHGTVPLIIVPVIAAIEPDVANFPAVLIRGSGFDPRSTEVIFITGLVPAMQITSVSPGLIRVSIRPAPGSEVRVRTPGGTSAGFNIA